MTHTTNNLAAYIWSLADLLRGDFKQSQYGRVILPFTLLRRLEGVLEASKPAVLAEYDTIQKMNLPEETQEKLLIRATGGLSFFNISKMDLSTLGEGGIKANLESYIQGFSRDAREIFEYFKFDEFIGQLNDANLLYKIVQKKVRAADLKTFRFFPPTNSVTGGSPWNALFGCPISSATNGLRNCALPPSRYMTP